MLACFILLCVFLKSLCKAFLATTLTTLTGCRSARVPLASSQRHDQSQHRFPMDLSS
ncbi:hypothetical protein GLYMA_01G078150v4 [Glycine max]|nr:hypothetical protein GLYMA_01G078150v4 [Glycine max]KAH1162116.1 hypothetical protein GYH30_000835 [Glycine max]